MSREDVEREFSDQYFEATQGRNDKRREKIAHLLSLTPLVAQTPTPTVKEESHTQGWNRAESEQCVRANVMHPENGSQESAVRYILEHFGVVIAAIASQEYQRGALYNHEGTFTRGFEAGRLQGIADAVAVVPETDSRNKHGM